MSFANGAYAADHLDASQATPNGNPDLTEVTAGEEIPQPISGLNNAPSNGTYEPIAVVGMGMRLPGDINNADDFWKLLTEKRDGRVRVPEDRYNVDAFYDENGKPGTVKMTHGNFLQCNLKHIDNTFFSMTRAETEKLDPQARLLLEVSREALENAGETDWRGKSIGCYVGVFGEDWQDLHLKDAQDAGMYRVTGYGDFLLGNRISYENDWSGPSMTIKTGCSSSLICLHLACQAIQAGECGSAIVAGTNLIMSPTMTIAMSEQGVLSSGSRSRTFCNTADGYSRGEAINAVYVKKLSDAIRDKNPIQAVIRATNNNSDGRTPGISHPSSEAHEALMRRSHEIAGLNPDDTAFVEAHGTGTVTGDPLEANAVARLFGKKGVYLGSVKPNIGHSEGASGNTSLIKAILALKHNQIPPNIHFYEPNPKIPFEDAGVTVPTETMPWPQGKAQRVTVNSFGLGGANANAVLDSAASFGLSSNPEENSSKAIISSVQPQRLLVFSANHADSLPKRVEQHKEYLTEKPHRLDDVVYTLGAHREHLPYRTFAITDGTSEWEAQPPVTCKKGATPDLTFVFTGQGAQWLGMGKELLTEYPSAMQDIQIMDKALQALPHPPAWTLQDEILAADNNDVEDENVKSKLTMRLQRAEFSQPLVTAVQLCIVNLLRSWGIKPSSVVGHSSGEIGGAYAAQALSMEEAITVAYYRGVVTKMQKRQGGMAAVGLSKEEVEPYLTEGVVVACENSPTSLTLSGDLDKLEVVMEKLKEEFPQALVRALKVEMAYHSHHMQEVGADYQSMLEKCVNANPTTIPFYSSVTGMLLTAKDNVGPKYWRQNLENPVLFSTAVQTLLEQEEGEKGFLEIGPHSALQGPLRQIFKAAGAGNPFYSGTLTRDTEAVKALLTAVGNCFTRDVPVDFAAMCEGKTLDDLPNYPWNHDAEYWDESRITKEWRLRKFRHHETLGSRITEASSTEPVWRNMLRVENVTWTRDHQVGTDTIFPGAGYVAMAGEAMRQISGKDDYAVRAFTISNAMVLHENAPTEVITSLRPVRLTTQLDSSWYEFSIVTHDGENWTKHCVGQVRAGPEFEPEVPEIKTLTRNVGGPKWYQAMRKVGLNYGPRFQGLYDIRTSTSESNATAKVVDDRELHDSEYQLHPAIIDNCIQLFSAAACNGLSRNLQQMSIPTYIDYIYVSKPEGEMTVTANAHVTPRGSMTGNGLAVADGKAVFELKGLQLTPLADDTYDRGPDPHAACRMHWAADADFLNYQDLVRPVDNNMRDYYLPVEKLALLCEIESSYRVAESETNEDHLAKYQSWLQLVNKQATAGENEILGGVEKYAKMTSEERVAEIEKTNEEIKGTVTEAAAIAIMRIYENDKDILEGSVDPLEILMEDDILTQLYNMGDRWDIKDFLRAISHTKPFMRILEIGAGTGGTTATVLPHLKSSTGERMFDKYTFTDISAGFFAAGKERFVEEEGMEYAVLDVTKEPSEQDFEEGSYDLIIATNVLHATPSLNETLTNVRKLLAPGGTLFLDELCSKANWLNYIMGTLSGWWLGESDGRPYEPYVQPERWEKELEAAGFAKPSAVVLDDVEPFQANQLILASPAPAEDKKEKKVSLLLPKASSPLVDAIKKDFQAKGFAVSEVTLQDEPIEGEDVVSLLDIDGPFLENVSEENWRSLITFIENMKPAGMLWVTEACQVDCKDPRYAQILGLARAIRNELTIDVGTIELEDMGAASSSKVLQVFDKFQRREAGDDYEADMEFAVWKDQICLPRFHWFSVNEFNSAFGEQDAPKALEIGKRGFLKTLGWVQHPSHTCVGDQVNINVRAVGMNFKDVLIAMGIVEGHEDEGEGLGCECAGIVSQVGPDVKNVKVGDRVAVFAGGSYATTLTTSSQLCAKIPDNLTFEDAATMPCVYSTVIYSVLHLGQLKKDQTILIQSACGGVGIAALNIAKMVGADIYCTVGSEEKIQYLQDNFDIPRSRIFNSRNNSFLRGIRKATGGRGVDLVLNSLSGELLHASWQCVAEFGKMIEIGKRDFIGRAKLAMEIFEANRAFFGVDFAQMCAERPQTTRMVLEECMDYRAKGLISPIHPVTRFEGGQIEEAFRYMQKGAHIGKIVVNMPENASDLPVAQTAQEARFRPEAAYLLVGGLGGLGKAISTWMVENGAKHLVYLSRSAGDNPADKEFFDELANMGAEAQCVKGDITNSDDVQAAINKVQKPISGILQMSMVLKDGQLADMTFEDWEAAVKPKVNGTWQLHEATKDFSLDFFVMFSSFSGLVGQRGQSNYASANCFLDAFVQYRHSKGLPASALDIGPVEEVGYVSNNRAVMEQFRATSLHILLEQDLLDSLQMSMGSSFPKKVGDDGWVNSSQAGIGLRMTVPSTAPNNRCIWKRDPRMAIYRNIEANDDSGDGGADPGLKSFLAESEGDPSSLKTEEAIDFLATEFGKTLYGFLLIPTDDMDLGTSVASLGVDSLVAIELRNWCRHKLGLDITVLELLDIPTLKAFGQHAAAKLYSKYTGGNEEEVKEAFLANKAP